MAQQAPSHQKGPKKPSEESPLLSDERSSYHSTTTHSPSQHSRSETASIEAADTHNSNKPPNHAQASWHTLPHKPQLLTLLLASLSSPLAQYSQTSYLFHQIHWFDLTLPSSDIALRAAYLTAAFAGAQCATALLWGTLADNERVGRKTVLVVGLTGSAIAAVGVGFVRSFESAVWWRILAGIMTGNGGVGRVVVAEIVGGVDEIVGAEIGAEGSVERRREYQARAFLLLPICYNVGVIVGPLVGGLLADPMGVLGDVGHKEAGNWLRTFPFALPNMIFAILFGTLSIVVVLGLDETHPRLKGGRDRGRELGMWMGTKIHATFKNGEEDERLFPASLGQDEEGDTENLSTEATAVETSPLLSRAATPMPVDNVTPCTTTYNSERSFLSPVDSHEDQNASLRPPSPIKTILTTPNILLTMLLRFLQSLHISAFYAIYTVLLPTPRSDSNSFHPPFLFSGGLGLSPQKMGVANTIIGMIGLPLQIILYPHLVSRIGVRRSYAAFLPLSILAYLLLPFLILLPEDHEGLLWVSLCCVLSLQVLSRTFINPAGIMLVNDCAPSGEMVGSVHGLGVTVSSAAKIAGPLAGGAMLGWGLANGCVVVPLWVLGGVAAVNLGVLGWVGDANR